MKNIKYAIKSILHFRTFSGINILGLALSLACVLIIFRYVYGELTVDHFNKNLDRMYLTTLEYGSNPGNAQLSGIQNSNNETTFVDLREHPGIENFSNFIWFDNDEIAVDEQKFNATILVADSNFMKITDYPLISGIHKLSEPHNALITKNFAQKLFGNENPVGKTFRHSTGEILTVSGVIGQLSTKTSLSFDVIVSYYLSDWSRMAQTFVLLYPGVDYQAINKQYEDFFYMRSYRGDIRHQLFPLSKVYFDKSNQNWVFKQGNYSYVTVLITVGVLILLTGIINYINIYTVVVLRRGKELGVKKILGAGGHNIFTQLLTENMLMTGLALFFAFLIAGLAHPLITNVLQLDMVFNIRFDILLSLVILLALPVITTLYPFFRYHYSTVVNSMRGFDKIKGKGSLRQVFLSFQYVITIVMIVVSLFFIKQLQFMLNADLGYSTKNIVKVQFLKNQSSFTRTGNMEERQKTRDREERIADEIVQRMNASPLFSHWAYGESPNKFTQQSILFKLPGGEFKEIAFTSVDESWLRLFDIQLKEGRLWDDKIDEGYRDYFLIVTESVLKLYGITDFNDALLQSESRLWRSSLRPQEEMRTNPPFQIVGVVKDFNYLHLSQKTSPTVFLYSSGYQTDPLIASIVPGRTQEAIEFLQNLHKETVGGEFIYSFVDDEISAMYREDKRIATIYSVFTFIAISISALGLFGMSLFDTQSRRKEIAIRKIHGASVIDIIRLLLKKYFVSLAISFVIATPVALLAINRYLDDFANKAPVSWWLFAVAITIATLTLLLTLIYQTVRAANQNPAEVVKSE